MNIAIVGYGRMGHAVSEQAQRRGHTINCVIDADTPWDQGFGSAAFRGCDVMIEFSRGEAAPANWQRAFEAGVPVVSGTTGVEGALRDLAPAIEGNPRATLLWSPNFSVGVNLFRRLNLYLARMMEAFPQYVPSVAEVHHVHKLDHPSGTAISLAQDLLGASTRLTHWQEAAPEGADAPAVDALVISHERRGEVPGIHTVKWESPIDSITIEHSAKSRQGFALGAVMAAEWLMAHPRQGLVSLQEMYDELLPTSTTSRP